MKKYIGLTILFIMMMGSNISAQNLGAELKALLKEKGYSISKELFSDLAEGETAYYTKTFYAGTNYAIIAYSEEYGVSDIDIYLYDDDGSVLVKDTDSDQSALVEYSPYVSREMKVVIKNYNSESSVKEYDCRFIIAYYND